WGVLLVGSVEPGGAVPVLQRVGAWDSEVASCSVEINAHVLDGRRFAEVYAEPVFLVAGAEGGPAAGGAVLVVENLSVDGLERAALRAVVVGDGLGIAVAGEVGGGVDPVIDGTVNIRRELLGWGDGGGELFKTGAVGDELAVFEDLQP